MDTGARFSTNNVLEDVMSNENEQVMRAEIENLRACDELSQAEKEHLRSQVEDLNRELSFRNKRLGDLIATTAKEMDRGGPPGFEIVRLRDRLHVLECMCDENNIRKSVLDVAKMYQRGGA